MKKTLIALFAVFCLGVYSMSAGAHDHRRHHRHHHHHYVSECYVTQHGKVCGVKHRHHHHKHHKHHHKHHRHHGHHHHHH